MKKLIKYVTSLGIILCLFLTILTPVHANEVNKDEKGSIIFDYRHDDTPLDDVEFKVYHITTLDENDNHIWYDRFKDFEVDSQTLSQSKNWLKLRDNLENYINYEMLVPEQIFYTDGDGEYHLEDLDLGIYFIQAEVAEKSDKQIFSEPILVTVGHYDHSDDKWIYHYKVQPKISVLDEESYKLTVKKVWENTNSDLLIPDSIKVELHKNGKLFETVILNSSNKWTYTWTDVDPCATWAVKELDSYEDFKVDYTKDILSFTITNTYTGTPDEDLPQTGSNAHLIPIFSSIGLVLILVGILLKYSFRCKEND